MLSVNRTVRKLKLVRSRERGLVLIMVMIVLVAMMFAGVAMLRSVDTANMIAGNMAFRQGATHQGDIGVETAVAWLESQNGSGSTTLQSNNTSKGYYATLTSPTSGQTWDAYWNASVDPSPVSRPVATAVNSGNTWTLATSSNNYTVSYVIHRMCPTSATNSGCTTSPTGSTSTGNSNKAGNSANFTLNTQVYYRITTRIEGPRNTVSYVQAVVAM